MKKATPKEEFKKIASIQCSCGCGKSLAIKADIKTGRWIIAVLEDGWKNKNIKHIGFDIMLSDDNTKSLKTFIKELEKFLEKKEEKT